MLLLLLLLAIFPTHARRTTLEYQNIAARRRKVGVGWGQEGWRFQMISPFSFVSSLHHNVSLNIVMIWKSSPVQYVPLLLLLLLLFHLFSVLHWLLCRFLRNRRATWWSLSRPCPSCGSTLPRRAKTTPNTNAWPKTVWETLSSHPPLYPSTQVNDSNILQHFFPRFLTQYVGVGSFWQVIPIVLLSLALHGFRIHSS